MTKPDYEFNWHHIALANKIQDWYKGKTKPKLMIFAPPQHGKSEIVSRRAPAWMLGDNPKLKIVGASYSADLSTSFNRDIQRIIDDEVYASIFPNTFLNESNARIIAKGNHLRNTEVFETVNHRGFYKSVGVGGSLTGTAVDIGIIDDPVKDAMEAYSERTRNSIWEWYLSVFCTRLHNKSKVLLTMTRWHEDDLAGRILKKEHDKWDVFILPAIKEDNSNEYDPREIGEALWEGRHSLERLRDIEATSKRVFISLYQQRPTAEGGNMIKKADLQIVSSKPDKGVINFIIDSAYTEKQTNDPTCIMAWMEINNCLLITNVSVVRLEYPELLKHIQVFCKQNGYTTNSRIYVEPKATGKSIVQSLKRETGLNIIEDESPTVDKVAAVNVVLPMIDAQRVLLLYGGWNDNFITECTAFPLAKHDDQVDCLVKALNKLNKPKFSYSKV